MRYIADHDFHIHSKLSLCSDDPLQTKERILQYAVDNNFKKIVVTDHFWDENISGTPIWYVIQNYEHVKQNLPLPQAEGIEFKFGCETEINTDGVVGVTKETCEKFDFIVIPTNHLHLPGLENKTNAERKELYLSRVKLLFDLDLPFRKIGIAHLTDYLLAGYNNWQGHIDVIDSITDREFRELFLPAQEKGMGIELNMEMSLYTDEELERILRPYRIAKECGCKFYFGSDAHHPERLDNAKADFERLIDRLALEESDKFDF